MSLLKRFMDAADDLVDETKEKVTSVTGVDADKLVEAAESFAEAGSSLSEGVHSIQEGRTEG